MVAGLARRDQLLASGAVDVLICGGGHGILAKSLTHGVPVVTIPGGGDQWELANQVSRIGVGELVRPVTADTVTGAVRTVLDDRDMRTGPRRSRHQPGDRRSGDGNRSGSGEIGCRTGGPYTDRLDAVRLTEFTELMNAQFGVQTADSILTDHVLIEFGGRTGAQAIEDGRDPARYGSRSAATSTCPANAGSPHSMPVKAPTSEDLRLWRTLACGEPWPVENLGLWKLCLPGIGGRASIANRTFVRSY